MRWRHVRDAGAVGVASQNQGDVDSRVTIYMGLLEVLVNLYWCNWGVPLLEPAASRSPIQR